MSVCGTAKATETGCVWLMVTRGTASAARTLAPGFILVLPVRPVIGAATVR